MSHRLPLDPGSTGNERSLGRRTVLVPDLGGAPLIVLSLVEQVLADLRVWELSDALDPPERAALQLPVPLAGGVALGAVRRLARRLGPTQRLGVGRGRLLGPDGCYEHTSLSVVTVPVVDVELLIQTAGELGRPDLDPDVVEVIAGYGERLAGTDPPSDINPPSDIGPESPRGAGERRVQLVAAAAALAGLLDLAPTEDTQLLVARLAMNPLERDLALTAAEEAAYAATVGRIERMWSAGSPTPVRRLY